MKKNPIKNLSFILSCQCKFLEFFDISYTNIEHLQIKHLNIFENLKILNLFGNEIISIDHKFFGFTVNLIIINMNFKGNFRSSDISWIKYLEKISFIGTEDARLCYLARHMLKHHFECSNPVIKNCSLFIEWELIVSIYWLLGLLGILLNILSISLVLTTKTFSKVYKMSLSMSDLLTSGYCLSIVCVHTFYGEEFIMFMENWRSSIFCRILGISLPFSLLLSTLSLLLIAFERFLNVIYPLNHKKIIEYPKFLISIMIILCFGSSFIFILDSVRFFFYFILYKNKQKIFNFIFK